MKFFTIATVLERKQRNATPCMSRKLNTNRPHSRSHCRSRPTIRPLRSKECRQWPRRAVYRRSVPQRRRLRERLLREAHRHLLRPRRLNPGRQKGLRFQSSWPFFRHHSIKVVHCARRPTIWSCRGEECREWKREAVYRWSMPSLCWLCQPLLCWSIRDLFRARRINSGG